MHYQQVLSFWFDEILPVQWWQKDLEFDLMIKRRFTTLHQQACAGELFTWRQSALGSLAEIIVLDQFSRNIYREQAAAFSADGQALALAQRMIENTFDTALDRVQRGFVYLPFMHSESKLIHEHALRLYESLGQQDNLNFERKHKAIIDRFGRYPHRNVLLGRASTEQELAYLAEPGAGF